jgi:FkbM family methyltransferase
MEVNSVPIDFSLKRNSSDTSVFHQIIYNEEYSYVISLIKKLNFSDGLVIDAGANVGLTSLYLKSFFPAAKIIAIEPGEDTFFRLQNHLKINEYNDVSLLKKGLWSESTGLKADLSFRDGQDWSFRLVAAKDDEEALFEAISVPDLISKFDIKQISLLKVDIEGGEAEIFKEGSDLSWLSLVQVIAIEIHDEFDCRSLIESSLEKAGFELSHSGELTIGQNKRLIAD